MTPSQHHPAGAESATELLSRRAQLQDWLSRLDEVDDIPAQVARRVRADYEQRLDAVVAELSAHTEALAADRERLEERLLAAAERHDTATDALEEARLRHRIGELSAEDWESRRPGLEAELQAAAAERAETEQEISALEELFVQIAVEGRGSDEATLGAGAASPAPPAARETPVASRPADFAEAAEEWVPDLPTMDQQPEERAAETGPWEDAPEPLPELQQSEAAAPEAATADEEPLDVGAYSAEAEPQEGVDEDLVEITNFAAAAEALADEVDPAPADEDYAFLQELDRAIAATAPSSESEEEEPQADTRPQPGLKCPDCGYSNDPAAWYCGVCGVDLG